MKMIFSGKEPKIVETKKYIEKLKYMFRVNSRKIVSVIHMEDWEELEQSMVKTMKEHFEFWNSKIVEINELAKHSLKNLQIFHKESQGNFKEFLEKVESLLPKDQSEVKALENAKDVLLNGYEFKDARYIKKRANSIKEKNLVSTIKKRKRKIEHKQDIDLKRKEREKDMLLYTILRAFERLAGRRQKDFERLWVKYIKVKRIIENLHHQEKFRLRDLESNFHFNFRAKL